MTTLDCTSYAVTNQPHEYNQVLWHHSVVWQFLGDKQTTQSKSEVSYYVLSGLKEDRRREDRKLQAIEEGYFALKTTNHT